MESFASSAVSVISSCGNCSVHFWYSKKYWKKYILNKILRLFLGVLYFLSGSNLSKLKIIFISNHVPTFFWKCLGSHMYLSIFLYIAVFIRWDVFLWDFLIFCVLCHWLFRCFATHLTLHSIFYIIKILKWVFLWDIFFMGYFFTLFLI